MNASKRTEFRTGDDPVVDEFEALSELRRRAPAEFHRHVMSALPGRPQPDRRFWQVGWAWLSPSAVGVLSMLLVAVGLVFVRPHRRELDTVSVQFEFHAPDAQRVELMGDFTAWNPGRILLDGPDESGHWTARVKLPAGRYEYLFLVDGREWVVDPSASVYRPDGFGNQNGILML